MHLFHLQISGKPAGKRKLQRLARSKGELERELMLQRVYTSERAQCQLQVYYQTWGMSAVMGGTGRSHRSLD